MKVALDEAGTVCAVSKTLPIAAASGEAIGAYRFDADTGRRFLDDVRWRHSQGDVTSFYEASFDRLFREGARAEAIGVDPLAWVEIDDHADLARARACVARDSGRDEAGRVVAHG
jgi:choline kinase